MTRQKPIHRSAKNQKKQQKTTTLTFVTSNAGKAEEVQELMSPISIDTVVLTLPELQGQSDLIVVEKAKYACDELQRPVLVDDTSLGFAAWKGLPGQYIGPFHKQLGTLGLYQLFEPFRNRRATAQCFLGYCEPGKKPIVFVGTVEGTIVSPRRSSDRTDTASFGWDPIFLPNGLDKTYGEMTVDEKNAVSHRRKAIDKLKAYLKNN